MEETTPQLKPMSNKTFFTALLLLLTVVPTLVISIWFFSFWSPFDNTPIEIPIDLSKAGSVVEVEMRAWGKLLYEVDLEFILKGSGEDKRADYEKLCKFLGCNYHQSGTEIPIKLTIYKLDHRDARSVIFNESFIAKERSTYTRSLSAFSLERGKFIIRVENLKGFQELVDRKIHLNIHRSNSFK